MDYNNRGIQYLETENEFDCGEISDDELKEYFPLIIEEPKKKMIKTSIYSTKICFFNRVSKEVEEDYEPPLNQLALKKEKKPIPYFESKLEYVDTSSLVWAKHHRFGLSCGRVHESMMILCEDDECFVEFFCLPKGKKDHHNRVKVYKKSVEFYNSEKTYFAELKKVLLFIN
jgi:hypothetical protein